MIENRINDWIEAQKNLDNFNEMMSNLKESLDLVKKYPIKPSQEYQSPPYSIN
ncbi:hypothetical protein ACFL1H_03015 [Nanoarchaeota archaeon]